MKNYSKYSSILLFLVIPLLSSAQSNSDFELGYEVYKIFPSLSVTQAELQSATTIADVNRYYKPSWVSEYKLVKVTANVNGVQKESLSKSLELSSEQKELMLSAETHSDISVHIEYIPENNLSIKELKEIDFSFTVDPDLDAAYPGGEDALKRYIKKNTIDKIPASSFEQYAASVIEFSINENGEVVNAEIFDTSMFSKSEDLLRDNILLEAICAMPKWTPAQYKDGKKIKQDFILTVGDLTSCILNTFNTHLLN